MDRSKLPLHPDDIELSAGDGFRARDKVESLLERAGIVLNGNQPWDMQVLDPRAYSRILSQGSLGLGEAYMDGWWECEQLDEFIHRALRADLEAQIRVGWYDAWQLLRGLLANLQSKARAFMVGEQHYDLGNQLYQCMLDSRMTYTCGYWRNAADLEQAQASKLDLVCRKIGLQPGDRVLDIGCGWGSFAEFAARNYSAEVVGITISREQAELARVRCSGLPVDAAATTSTAATMMQPKALIAWSSGKDSAWALHEVRQAGKYEIVAALTTVTDTFGRVSMHGVREELLQAQLAAARLPPIVVRIPFPCPNDVYEREMAAAMAQAKADGVTHVIFGDLFLEDVRAYREQRLEDVGMQAVFPLWQRPTEMLAREMIAGGLEATLATVDLAKLPSSFAGRRYDEAMLADLPRGTDPCGENGEFHSFVSAGPMFARRIPIAVGETVTRDGFAYVDLLRV